MNYISKLESDLLLSLHDTYRLRLICSRLLYAYKYNNIEMTSTTTLSRDKILIRMKLLGFVKKVEKIIALFEEENEVVEILKLFLENISK